MKQYMQKSDSDIYYKLYSARQKVDIAITHS